MSEALENLKLVLSSPKERKRGTMYSYLSVANIFLTWLGDSKQPTDKDYRRYFIWRRKSGISESTLGKDFAILKKLANANDWAWTFTKEDRPEAEGESYSPAFTLQQVETFIRSRNNYSPGEKFYLALSTTWGLRRQDMANIKKRDYDGETIFIRRAKGGQKRRHLIPDEIKDIIAAHRANIGDASSLTRMFHRIANKAGLSLDAGYGFHSIRRSLATFLPTNLARAGLDISLMADYMGWSRRTKGMVFFGSAMPGVYGHPEILRDDPYAVDRLVIPVHPFLPFYRK